MVVAKNEEVLPSLTFDMERYIDKKPRCCTVKNYERYADKRNADKKPCFDDKKNKRYIDKKTRCSGTKRRTGRK